MPEQMRPMSMTPLDYDREKSSSSKVKVEKENLILSFMCRTLKAHTEERLELPPIPTAAELLLKKKSLISGGCFEYRQRFSIFTRQVIRIQKVGSHPQ